ncbi:hypothetical protein AAMO2058_001372400 [Amorphochlora amoebiformis]
MPIVHTTLLRRARRFALSKPSIWTIFQLAILAGLLFIWLPNSVPTRLSRSPSLATAPDESPSFLRTVWGYVVDNLKNMGRTVSAATLLAICAGLCISAGSGGGGLYVPLLIALLGKEVHTATSTSQILIFGASSAGVIYDWQQRHPERERPLIDLSVILYLAPIMMAGALVGSTISSTLPPSLIMLMLVVACSIAAFKSLRKGFRLWQAEHKRMDLDFMDTMEPIDPVAIVSCGTRACAKDDTPQASRQISKDNLPHLVPEVMDKNPIPAHDHVIPRLLRNKDGSPKTGILTVSGLDKGIYGAHVPSLSAGKRKKKGFRTRTHMGKRNKKGYRTMTDMGMIEINTPEVLEEEDPTASDAIYYKKLRDLRRKNDKPFEVMGIHRISFWNPKCKCVFSTFRDQDFVQVFQFLSKKELFSCRAVCLRWHFLSHAKELELLFGNLKRTVSYSVIWNPETPLQYQKKPMKKLASLSEEPLTLGPSFAKQMEEEDTPKHCNFTTLGEMKAKEVTPLLRKKKKTVSFNAPALKGYGLSKAEKMTNVAMGQDVEIVVPTKGGKRECLLAKQQQKILQAREKSREIIMAEQHIQTSHVMKILALVVITFALIVARGGKGTKSVLNVQYCGEVYWAVTGSSILLLLVVAYISGKDLFDMHIMKIACHYPFAKGDPHWDHRYLSRMAGITFGTGIAAGILGVGGGMFLSPVLFEMGMLPLVVAAISTSCILLSSSVLTVLIIMQGTVDVYEVSFYFFGTVMGAFIGKFFVRKIVARYRSSAIIPIILGGVIIASMVVATYQNVTKFVAQLESGHIQGFKGVCQAAS